jgi:hypothetical protein
MLIVADHGRFGMKSLAKSRYIYSQWLDACTRWSKFVRILSALSIDTAKAFDKNWLCHYPRPRKVIHDKGIIFLWVANSRKC